MLWVIQLLFNVYIIVLLIRLVLQAQGAHFYNPVTYTLFKLTQPLIRPLQRFIPGYRGIDLSIVFLIFIVEIAKLLLLVGLINGRATNIGGLVLWGVMDLIGLVLAVYFYAIIARVIVSWFVQSANPYVITLELFTEPLMKPARRMIPPIGGFDVSPIALLVLIELTRVFIVAPWLQYTSWMALV